MKKHKNVLIIVFSICLRGVLLFLIGFTLAIPKLRSNLTYWEKSDYSEFKYGSRLEKFLPAYNENNNYSEAKFYYHKGCISFDYADEAYCLELDFSETEYNKSKESIRQNYNFLEDIPLENEKLGLANYKIGKYRANFVEISDSKFPHEIGLIAYDDSQNRIRYYYIVDMSLDYFENETGFRDWITNNMKVGW